MRPNHCSSVYYWGPFTCFYCPVEEHVKCIKRKKKGESCPPEELRA